MNWIITNAPTASPAAREIIRATNVLDHANAGDDRWYTPLTDIQDMIDLTLTDWALGLAEILTTGLGTPVTDENGRECLFLTIQPTYAPTPEAG
ncbi:hypothetical protein LH935_28375 (plasmid) [Gordonia polyisoprenivorans]|uniref:hypothetical protein n=1 Tax=Gordonia polyisoprenivorans TaxID=84595 RepID=UPI002234E183|nr:hypothetical protein LH935_28375 [Gordonia polyisoprenivorans]